MSVSTLSNVVFTASGGSGIYTWTLSNTSLGFLTINNAIATYQNAAVAGINILTVADSSNNTATATITQNNSTGFPPLP